MTRWTITLALCLAAVLAVLGSAWLGESLRSLERERDTLRGKANELIRLKTEREQLAARAERIRALLARADEVSMGPDHWFTNPLEGASEMDWDQLSGLIRLVSSAHPLSTGYWYRPGSFRLELTEDRDTTRVGPGGDPVDDERSAPYSVRVRGEFFIPR